MISQQKKKMQQLECQSELYGKIWSGSENSNKNLCVDFFLIFLFGRITEI